MDELLLADTGGTAEEVLDPQRPSLVFLDRERSILAFNRRVLAQARRDEVPPLERLRYVTIMSSNLDEFFEVRFADISDAAWLPGTAVSAGEVQAVAAEALALVKQQYAVFSDEVMPALEQQGLVVLTYSQRLPGFHRRFSYPRNTHRQYAAEGHVAEWLHGMCIRYLCGLASCSAAFFASTIAAETS